MNTELKTKWVEALRSGKYAQGRGGLHKDNEYCCLGVLCEIGDLGEWKPGKYEGDDGKIYDSGEFECHFKVGRVDEALLPPEVREVIGLADAEHKTVWKMNDDLGKSFPEIADYIEANL